MARVRSLSSQTVVDLGAGWIVQMSPVGSALDPVELASAGHRRIPATVPGTLACALQEAGSPLPGGQSPDDFDVWYECSFEAAAHCFESYNRTHLRFDGLATIADVWLNGQHLLRSENMFLRHEPDVTSLLRPGSNTIAIRFASLNQFLKARRPRPRWRTHLVDDPQLRWVRTTLLGRMPGWHHNAQAIHCAGPWRPISLVTDSQVHLRESRFRVSVDVNGTGTVEASLLLESLTGRPIASALLGVGNESMALEVGSTDSRSFMLKGALSLESVDLWWPHTHGDPALYPVRVELSLQGANSDSILLDFGTTGFRSVVLDTRNDAFALSVNGSKVFFRGACWTSLDAANVAADPDAYDRPLDLAARAGMNMLRVPGFAFYETDAFYDGCAQKGISVWQDFAFALMDYPTEDPAFAASAEAEIRQFLDRIQLNPAFALLCSNSECAATAAMNGLTADDWGNALFDDLIPEIARAVRPDLPYVPSSEWGGALPFHVNAGVSNYYGVGAYLRPLDDARRCGLRFAAECLAFANIPEDETIDRFLANREWPGNHPSWKAAVPRNVSLGWDFDDVRDHYVRTLLDEDPSASRFSDSDRYLALGRVASGEAMYSAFTEWRRPGSTCDGALVLFFQDLWPGAGWGLFDSFGQAKSVYYYLKRALSPLAVFFSDEGLSGLRVHIVNDRQETVDANLRLTLYRHGKTPICDQTARVTLGSRAACEFSVDGLLGVFQDTAYAYKFGPPSQNVTVASLEAINDGSNLAPSAFYFPAGRKIERSEENSLVAKATRRPGEAAYDIEIVSPRFAQAVAIETRGYSLDDNYFHLEPGKTHRIIATPDANRSPKPFGGTIGVLNGYSRTKIAVGDD